MTKNARIKELEKRISHLEQEFSALCSLISFNREEKTNSLSYEEVIDLWLNGKET